MVAGRESAEEYKKGSRRQNMSDIVKYQSFELPGKISIEEDEKDPNRCRFVAEPLERGFGHTIGNALRRVLMTAIESPAILSFKMEGVPHEYMAVEGIIEDVTNIVINLKGALLRRLPTVDQSDTRGIRILKKTVEVTPEMLEKAGGGYKVRLKDIIQDGLFDVVNPDHEIFTVTVPMTREVTLRVGYGRGYLPSERIEGMFEKVNDEIVIDALYSPVRLVNYFVEDTRVGGQTDMDRVILDIHTDGRISPKEALSFAAQIINIHFSIFDELNFQTISFDTDEEETPSDRDSILHKLSLKISEIELSVRSTNCLQIADIDTIAELVIMQEIDMLKFRNFGKKSLNEIKAKLDEMGLSLGMDLTKYGINKDNVKDIVAELAHSEKTQ